MEELLLHIEYLLRANDCVIVPGLGAFLVVRADAAYDYDAEVVTPVSREVVFNGSIVNNDGLLVNSVARRRSVPYAEAALLVEQAVSQLRAHIKDVGMAEIASVGTLSENPEGALLFAAAVSSAGRNAMLGYRPVSFRTRAAGERMAPSARTFDTARNYYIAVNKRFAHVAAMIAVILLAAVSVLIPASERAQRDMASVVPADVVKAIGGSELSENSEESELSEGSELSEKSEDSEKSEKSEVEEIAEPEYYLVVGTFRSPTEAARFAGQAGGHGFELKTVTRRNLTRVYAAAGDSRDALLDIQRSADFRKHFADAWIWEAR